MVTAAEILSIGALSRVTPSRWTTLRQCAWRVLLARYFKNKSLLPVHPNATLGSILHSALEKITTGELRSKEDLDFWWDEKVNEIEKDLTDNGLGRFVPLKENARHFGLKKVQVRNRLFISQKNQSFSTGTASKRAEKKLVSADGLLAGQLDCITWQDGQAEVRDYKTGIIANNEEGEKPTEVVKEEYQLQMKLYACLFKENYGIYPARLILEDLNGKEYEVKFTPEECLQLLEEVKSFLESVNQKIAEKKWENLATLGDYCAFCNYRPACPKYLRHLNTALALDDKGWHDLSGILASFEENDISGLSLQIQRAGKLIKINGFDIMLKDKLRGLINQEVTIFNLIPQGVERFACTKFSEIYAI